MSALLLDTHVVIWLATEPSRVSVAVQEEIIEADRRFISTVSFAEIALKHRKHPSRFAFSVEDLQQTLVDLRAVELPFRSAHAWRVSHIAPRHKDPFDHLLMAQAIVERLPLVTLDRDILNNYGRLKGLHFVR